MIHNVTIVGLDDDGYLWVQWYGKLLYLNKGKARLDLGSAININTLEDLKKYEGPIREVTIEES